MGVAAMERTVLRVKLDRHAIAREEQEWPRIGAVRAFHRCIVLISFHEVDAHALRRLADRQCPERDAEALANKLLQAASFSPTRQPRVLKIGKVGIALPQQLLHLLAA